MLFQLGYSQYSINQNNLEYNLLIYLLGNPTVSSDSVESIINRIIMVNTLGLVRGAVVGKVVGLFLGT